MKARRWRHCLCACLLWASAVQAHDSITADAASRYLQQADTLQTAALTAAAPAQRSAAWLSLGQMIEEIVDLLNRDVAAHGDVQGLPSRLLVSELPRRGVVLARQSAEVFVSRHPDSLRSDAVRAMMKSIPAR